jgi:hypothetical protein
MNEAAAQIDHELEAERRLLEAAVAEARVDLRPSVPHDQVRAKMLDEIERLNRKIAGH